MKTFGESRHGVRGGGFVPSATSPAIESQEDNVREKADQYDADLLLRLYDLRREERLRRAREWFTNEFQAGSLEEYNRECPPGSEKSAFFRMVVSYWDMVGSIVNHGLIKEEFFFENTSEFFLVWEKIKGFSPKLREARENSLLWKNLETLALNYEQWMSKRAPKALEVFRKRIQEMSAPKSA